MTLMQTFVENAAGNSIHDQQGNHDMQKQQEAMRITQKYSVYFCVRGLKNITMEPGKKKSFLMRNIEWIALIILIIAGLIAIWQYYVD
jgi:hypothetical protein